MAAEPWNVPMRPGYGPVMGVQGNYMPGAPYATPPFYCPPDIQPKAKPPAPLPPAPYPNAKEPTPELPAPKAVEPRKTDEGRSESQPSTQSQPNTQTQPNMPTPQPDNTGLPSTSDLASGLSSGVGGMPAPGGGGDMGGDAMAGGPSGTAPGMIGPCIPYSTTRLIQVQFLGDGTIFPETFAGAPVASRAMFYIGENESPQPQDRIFLTFNWYTNVNKEALSRVPENALIRDYRLISRLDAFYETFGFEKSFWCNWASVGLRVPFFQLQQKEPTGTEAPVFQIAEGLDQNTIGDISVILKTVLAYDCQSNNLLSGGLVVTLPTSPEVKAYNAHEPVYNQVGRGINTTIFQPWVGWFFDLGHVYVHGFSSVSIPLESDDVYVWFASGGVGWLCTEWLVPTAELHYYGPLNESSDLFRQPIGVVDQLIFTGGVHVPFYDASTLTLGLSTPLTGPGTFDVGIIAQLNVRF
jgi:hypothetical protein